MSSTRRVVGYKQADIDAKLKSVFDGVFYGPDKVYFEVGDSMAYISDIKNHDVRTEGMSYGLMIAVQFDLKDIFDRLWRWGTKYMQHQDGPLKGYFAWSCETDGTRNSQGPFVEKGSDGRILIAKDAGVEGIGGHAPHAKEQKGFQGTDVLIPGPQ